MTKNGIRRSPARQTQSAKFQFVANLHGGPMDGFILPMWYQPKINFIADPYWQIGWFVKWPWEGGHVEDRFYGKEFPLSLGTWKNGSYSIDFDIPLNKLGQCRYLFRDS